MLRLLIARGRRVFVKATPLKSPCPVSFRRKWKRNLHVLAATFSLFAATVLLWPMDANRYLKAEASGEMLDRSGRTLHAFLNENEQWCFVRGLEDISPRLVQATIAVEDQRFHSHLGVDPAAVVRAFWQNLRGRRVVSGASTLTMQVVKLGGRSSRSLPGKLFQTIEALRLDCRASKDDILQAYLNNAPYGMNLVGCEAASRRYFGKPSSELTLGEAALLAALPKAPTRLMPLRRPERATERRNYVLGRMLEEGFITSDEFDRASRAPLRVARHAFPRLAPHLALRLAPEIRARKRLRTTIDLDVQVRAERLAKDHLKDLEEDVTNAAIVVLDARDAEILARVGSANFHGASEGGGQFDVTRALRQPGSTLKPFAYALAIERNLLYPRETLIDDTLDFGLYNPKNFDDAYRGLISATDALRESRNVPAIQVLHRLGQTNLYNFLKRAGIGTLVRPAEHYGLGMALGNCEVRLDELSAAYCALANLGEYRPLKILAAGRETETRRILSRDTCLALYEMLGQPFPGELDRQSLGIVGGPPKTCWKTGTSTGNHDAWTFVFNRQYVVGVWTGNNDNTPSRDLVGSTAALPLAKKMFRALEVKSAPAWPAPAGDLRPLETCALSGLPAAQWCPHTSPSSRAHNT